MKVLIVERQESKASIARQLLRDYRATFEWSHAASDADLRAIAESFKPNLVYCADRMPATSRSGAMDLLRLLTAATLEVMIVHVGDAPPTMLDSRDAIAFSADETPLPRPAEASTATWRGSLPSIFDTSWDAVTLSDAAGWITCANTNACAILCETRDAALGTILDPRYFTAAEHRSHRMAFFDNDDGYPTPVHLTDLVARMCARVQGAHTALPIVALHLPGLRVLTEAMGRGAADTILDIVDAELRSEIAGCGMVARLGENDAIAVLPDPSRPADAAIHVQSKRREDQPLIVARPAVENPVESRAVALHEPRLRANPAAPTAQIAATPAVMPALAAARPPMEAGLDDALRRNAIGVHYQPQFDLESGRGCGVEALARWYLTSGEAVAPTVFIPAAERAGMIDALGARVLRIASDAAATWRGRESQHLILSVKVSTLQINRSFTRTLEEVLRTSGFPAQRLELEVSESALLADRGTTTECLLQWKALGVRTAVIHAGNDYSSLRYLSKAPIDRLKLDRALIARMSSSDREVSMVRALIALGLELEIDVIAEGVETEAQLHTLMQLRCPQVQGYLLGRPMPLVPVQIALRKPWGNLPKISAATSPVASARVAKFLTGSASRS